MIAINALISAKNANTKQVIAKPTHYPIIRSACCSAGPLKLV
jgi:hypothetical protein